MNELVPNLRDVGGLDASDGTVAVGRLLRSAAPLHDDRAPDHIEWPPRVVLDLRSEAELDGEHPLAPTGATILNHPLLSALRPGVAPPESLTDLYLLMLRTSGGPLTQVVSDVANADGAALVHCAAGKDRTGVSVALVLSLLGVNRDDIVDDYLVTEKNEGEIQARFTRMYGPRRATLPSSYLTTPVEAITAVIDAWDAHPGGTIGWFESVGGQRSTIEQLRSVLVD